MERRRIWSSISISGKMVNQATRSPFCQKHLEMLDSVSGGNVNSWLSSQERKETPQRRVRQRVKTSAVSA